MAGTPLTTGSAGFRIGGIGTGFGCGAATRIGPVVFNGTGLDSSRGGTGTAGGT